MRAVRAGAGSTEWCSAAHKVSVQFKGSARVETAPDAGTAPGRPVSEAGEGEMRAAGGGWVQVRAD